MLGYIIPLDELCILVKEVVGGSDGDSGDMIFLGFGEPVQYGMYVCVCVGGGI